jgi:hypothetical protein
LRITRLTCVYAPGDEVCSDSEDAARRAAERYAAKHPNSCTFRGLCGAGDHYHVDKEINGFLVHTRHYYFPR